MVYFAEQKYSNMSILRNKRVAWKAIFVWIENNGHLDSKHREITQVLALIRWQLPPAITSWLKVMGWESHRRNM